MKSRGGVSTNSLRLFGHVLGRRGNRLCEPAIGREPRHRRNACVAEHNAAVNDNRLIVLLFERLPCPRVYQPPVGDEI
jgi:hypothetical protein